MMKVYEITTARTREESSCLMYDIGIDIIHLNLPCELNIISEKQRVLNILARYMGKIKALDSDEELPQLLVVTAFMANSSMHILNETIKFK